MLLFDLRGGKKTSITAVVNMNCFARTMEVLSIIIGLVNP